eukprot:Phypoly_transcript_14486.p1 GENE.Phypoly_transcript_14486~~Phypoly_transcript_14486.p1  ORF type:complete len:197 (+),score=45.83 Phypoly_transcript_14486:364-954(+)
MNELEVLEKKEYKPLEMADTETLNTWKTLICKLQKENPSKKNLPPALPAEIDRVERELGFSLPPPLKQLYSISDSFSILKNVMTFTVEQAWNVWQEEGESIQGYNKRKALLWPLAKLSSDRYIDFDMLEGKVILPTTSTCNWTTFAWDMEIWGSITEWLKDGDFNTKSEEFYEKHCQKQDYFFVRVAAGYLINSTS